MKTKELLQDMNVGNSVAEFDQGLDTHFIETNTFTQLVNGHGDIIAGDKGTGKTALFRILMKRHRQIPSLESVEILKGFNDAGSPVFQRLTEHRDLTEGQFITIWKAYILSLVGNWCLEICGEDDADAKKLAAILDSTDLRSADDSPQTIFSRLANLLNRILDPKSMEVSVTLTSTGIPIIVPKIEFKDGKTESKTVDHVDAFTILNAVLKKLGITVWVAMDRLDEAFQGMPEVEIPALRALLRTYLDLGEFSQLKLKLFVRRDLFRRIIGDGFVNLTHINAKKIEIFWEDEDLLDLLYKRMAGNKKLTEVLDLTKKSRIEAFNAVFPSQIDQGDRKPDTWSWMLSRIRDGNNVKPPRNLIDLVTKARDFEIRNQERDPQEFSYHIPLLTPESVRKGHDALSTQRVEDTLLAESGSDRRLIEMFRNGKAEHNETSLSGVLGLIGNDLKKAVRSLLDIGFLEEVGDSFKVPIHR